jgi:hypothetical protein
MTHWMALREHLEPFCLAWNTSQLHVGNNILNWSRWRIRIDGICAIGELYTRSIDEVILVGS